MTPYPLRSWLQLNFNIAPFLSFLSPLSSIKVHFERWTDDQNINLFRKWLTNLISSKKLVKMLNVFWVAVSHSMILYGIRLDMLKMIMASIYQWYHWYILFYIKNKLVYPRFWQLFWMLHHLKKHMHAIVVIISHSSTSGVVCVPTRIHVTHLFKWQVLQELVSKTWQLA